MVPRFITLSESISFRDLHQCILQLLPKPGSRVLDVGAGTGRDAAALAEMGHDVVAVEPMKAFLEAAIANHRSPRISWRSDSLPDLGSLTSDQDGFDFVLCHAVWQHLDDAERVRAIERIAALLAPRGVFALALRHGPAGAGRRYFPASAERTIEMAESVGLKPELCLENQVSAIPGKSNVRWTRLAFRK